MLFTLSIAETEKLYFIIVSKTLPENQLWFEVAKLDLIREIAHLEGLKELNLLQNLQRIATSFPEDIQLERLGYMINEVTKIKNNQTNMMVYMDGSDQDMQDFVNSNNLAVQVESVNE